MELKGPFELREENGYATVYDGDGIVISVLTDLELGWNKNGIERDYITSEYEYELLQEVVDLMNAGWEAQGG